MINTHIINRLNGIQQQLMGHHLSGTGLASNTIGNERESLIRDFLEKVFPNTYRFGTGVITDTNNNLSGQIDIAVEYPFAPSFPTTAGKERLFLAESIGAIIEVKSDIASQWNQLTATINKVKPIKKMKALSMASSNSMLNEIPIIGVGYNGYASLESLQKKLDETKAEERPDAVLIIDKGLFIGFGIFGEGAAGLYAFIISLYRILNSAFSAYYSLINYMK